MYIFSIYTEYIYILNIYILKYIKCIFTLYINMYVCVYSV